MSGLDEQETDVPICNLCKKVPEYWTLSSKGNKVWYYSKEYSKSVCKYSEKRDSIFSSHFPIFRDKGFLDDLDYVYCSRCSRVRARGSKNFINVLAAVRKNMHRECYT